MKFQSRSNNAGGVVAGYNTVTAPSYNQATVVQPAVASTYGFTNPVEVPSPIGISINSNFAKSANTVTSTKLGSMFNEILNLLPDSASTDAAINHLKSLVQNRKLSVDKDMNPVTKVFSEKINTGLKDLLAKDCVTFDKVIDEIIAKDTPEVAPVATTQKSKYAAGKENNLYEFFRAVVNYMNKEGIKNVNNSGKFNKIVTDMISDTKAKKFSDIINKFNILELHESFKTFLRGGI